MFKKLIKTFSDPDSDINTFLYTKEKYKALTFRVSFKFINQHTVLIL